MFCVYENLIDKKMKSLGAKINVPKELYPNLGQKRIDSHPYIEIKASSFYLVVNENGQEIVRKQFRDVESLLFEVFEGITFNMALQYELCHRIERQDCRRILFSYQLNLMQQLSFEWKSMLERKIEKILNDHPYNDK